MTLDLTLGEKIVAAYVLIFAFVGCLASLLLVLLIRDMGKWNDFIYLVYYMAIFQFLFDLLLPSFSLPPLSSTVILIRGLAVLFSLISYLISTVISYTVFHILHFKVVFDLSRWKWLVGLFVTTPALVMIIAIIIGLYTNDAVVLLGGFFISTYARVACALMNVIFFFVYKYQVYMLTNLRKDKLTNSDIAMRCLVDRMKWYPIIQIFARVTPTMNQLIYGFNSSYYDTTKLKFYLILLGYIITSFAPVGFLVVFLYMQPKAYSHAKNRLLGIFSCQNHPSLAGSEIRNGSPLPQNKHASDMRNTLQSNNAITPISCVGAEESEADWENRAFASVNLIRDNEESTFEDSEPSTSASSMDGPALAGAILTTRAGGSTNTTSNNANQRLQPPVTMANVSRPVDVVSKVIVTSSMDYGSSQQLREARIGNLNDDELINLATDNSSNNRVNIDNNDINTISKSSNNKQKKIENESL